MSCADCNGTGRIELLLSTVDCDCVVQAREDAAKIGAGVMTPEEVRAVAFTCRGSPTAADDTVPEPFCCEPGCAADPEWWQGRGFDRCYEWCDKHLPELEPGERRHRLDGKPFAGEMVALVMLGQDRRSRSIDPGTGDASILTVAKAKNFGCVEVDSIDAGPAFDKVYDALMKALASATGIPTAFLRRKE